MEYLKSIASFIIASVLFAFLSNCSSTKIYKFDDYDIKYLGEKKNARFEFYTEVNTVIATMLGQGDSRNLGNKAPLLIYEEGFIIHAKNYNHRKIRRLLKPLSKCHKW